MSALGPTVAVWRYALKDWHPDSGLTLEEWRAELAAEGWEPELPELAEGAGLVHEDRTVRRHAVRRWVPDRSTSE
jgi:hypothetical protein